MCRIIICLLLTISLSAPGQVAPERVMANQLESGKWVKIEKSLRKALSKDTLNPEARYLLSLFYFNKNYSTYNLDSSYIYVLKARQNYQQIPVNDRERLKKVPLDTILLSRLKSRIDSAAFEKAKQSNTIVSYQYFIDHNRTANQLSSAVELRDEVAFLDALKINNWTSFKRFMTLYPASHRKDEARTRYERLLYEDKTKDKKLSSYISFHEQFHDSPYRGEAERNIFELSTLTGSAKSFQGFITRYPKSKWAQRAVNILYGMQRAEGNETFNQSWLSDSLRKVESLNQFYWVPVFKSGLFGFMDEQGTETIAPQFESIGEDYNCGNITDHFLVTSSGLIGRDGSLLYKGKVNEARDLGLGFIEVTMDSGRYVLHESGFAIEKFSVDDARILANRFMGLKRNKKWAIYSLTGKSIVSFTSDDLEAYDSLLVVNQNGKKILTTPYRLIRDMERPEGKEVFVFDDVKRWGSQQYWVRNGLLEGVMDAKLNFIIPLDRQLLRKTTFGFLREKEKRLFIQGIPRFENKAFQSVYEQANWVRMQTPTGGIVLYEKTLGQVVEGDSAWFQRQIAFMVSGDSVHAYLPSGQKLSFIEKSLFRLMESKDSAAWIVLDEKKKKTIYDAASGVKLFTAEFDQIEPVSSKIFLITKSGKKGMVGEDGKVLVPPEYDAIVSTSDHTFSLLKDKKFGWYDARTRQLMKPVYDRNVKLYNDHYRLAFKEKGYAFIRPDGTPLGNFEWEDFQFWNDSVAWVKKNFQWILLSIHDQKVRIDRVRNFSIILDLPSEKIFSVRQDNATGIISNRRGIIIPFKYSDIINLGTAEDPLYFTERHIEEAAISVVVYYDKLGKIIRRQAMETDEFEKLVCDN